MLFPFFEHAFNSFLAPGFGINSASNVHDRSDVFPNPDVYVHRPHITFEYVLEAKIMLPLLSLAGRHFPRTLVSCQQQTVTLRVLTSQDFMKDAQATRFHHSYNPCCPREFH